MEIQEYIREFTLKDVVRVRNPKVVAFGGGTGLSTILRGLKKYTGRLTAIVTMGDDGGSSGMLREDLGILPPGDIRNCILSLADDENGMQELFNYRFNRGGLAGHSFGNLFLAAMCGISGDFYEAVVRTSDVLQISGQVLPVTLDDMTLIGVLENGEEIVGESHIPKISKLQASPVDHICLQQAAGALPETIDIIKEADIIIFGPGSLYTSIIPHLLVDGIEEAVMDSTARKYYVGNLMTQPGETTGYTHADHIAAIEKHCHKKDRKLFQYILASDSDYGTQVMARYHRVGAEPVKCGSISSDYQVITGDFAIQDLGCVRHDADALAKAIFENYMNGSSVNKINDKR